MSVSISETESFIGALRAQSQRYHSRHQFHAMMNEGRLSRRQIQGWIANRFYYQVNIPRKDAAILANCPDREVRRRYPSSLMCCGACWMQSTGPIRIDSIPNTVVYWAWDLLLDRTRCRARYRECVTPG
jgi:hypothetical protein